MPFDVAGAKAAGYSDSEIADYLGKQSNFDVRGALKAGYSPADVIGHLTTDAPKADTGPGVIDRAMGYIKDAASSVADAATAAPNVPDPVGVGLTNVKDDAGGGRGFVNPPTIAESNPDRFTIKPPEETQAVFDGKAMPAQRGIVAGVAQIGKTASLIPAVVPIVADAVKSAYTGQQDTSNTDAYFGAHVDQYQHIIDQAMPTPAERQSFADKIGFGIGVALPDLAMMVASGGVSAEPQAAGAVQSTGQFLQQTIMRGFDAMRPVMVKAGQEKANEVLERGGTVGDASRAGLTAALWSGFMGSAPMSLEGQAFKRALTGLPVGSLTTEMQRRLNNMAAPAGQEQPFSLEDNAVGAATNAMTAGVMGHPEQTPTPTREELGYKPAEPAPIDVAPVHASDDIVNAPTVDAAIDAATKSVPDIDPSIIQSNHETSVAQTSGIAAEMARIRALRQPAPEPVEAAPLAPEDMPKGPDLSTPADVHPVETLPEAPADGSRPGWEATMLPDKGLAIRERDDVGDQARVDEFNQMQAGAKSVDDGNALNGAVPIRISDKPDTPEIAVARGMADLLGTKLVLVEGDGGATPFNGVNFNGEKTGRTIFVSADSPISALKVFGHEVGHDFQNQFPDLYGRAGADGAYSGLLGVLHPLIGDARIAERQALYEKAGKPITHEQALGEIVNDMLGNRIGEKTFWNYVAQKNLDVFQQLATVVKSVLARIQDKLQGFGAGAKGEGKEAFGLTVKQLQQANGHIDQAMSKYLDAATAARVNANAEHMAAGGKVEAAKAPMAVPPEAAQQKPAKGVPAPDDQHIAKLAAEAQPVMHKMYAAAAQAKPQFDSTLQGIADEVGGKLKTADLKGTERASAKVASDYGGDPRGLKDLVRATIEVHSADEAQRAIAAIFEKFEVLSTGRRNHLKEGSEPMPGGYRDAKFNVRLPNGHVAEIQINLPAMLKAKKLAHPLYEESEGLRRKIREIGIDKATPEQLARRDELDAQQRAIYDPAWTEATKARNSDSEMGPPLRWADSAENSRGDDLSQAVQYQGPSEPSVTGMPSTSQKRVIDENLPGRSEAADSRFIKTSEPILREKQEADQSGEPPQAKLAEELERSRASRDRTEVGDGHQVEGLRIHETPLHMIGQSEDVPQFKDGADENGVVEPLGGKFDRRGVAPIQLWKRTNGALEVISGRHRLDLARRSGEKTIPSQIHHEADGFTARHAAALDAELNIRDGQGKVKDYVDYFKYSHITREEADARGLLARAIGARAYGIASEGSEGLIAAHRAGRVSDEGAVAIANAAPNDERLQAVGIRAIEDGKTIGQAANTVRAVKMLASEKADNTGDMFGFDDSGMREAEAMARVATMRQRELQTRISAISGAAKRPEIARQEGIKIGDSAAILRRVEELKAEKAAWDNWTTNPDLVEKIRADLKPEEALESYTPEEVVAKDAREADAARAEAKDASDTQAKLKADAERDEFGLTGSDRSADANPDQESMFSLREDQQEEGPDAHYSIALPGAHMLSAAKTHLSDLIDHALDDVGVYPLVAPMSSGTQRTRALAQNYVNHERLANYQWHQMEDMLTKHFDAGQREKMWEAADEQNVLLQQGQPTAGKGLDRLTPEERGAVEMLHNYGEELLQRAKAVGMFKGDGLPYWTPRMAVMVDANGEYSRPVPGDGKTATSSGQGRNFTKSSPNLKERKYLTAADTEAAMQAKLNTTGQTAELVRDIRTMPMAMARLERAIAGRELVNQIQALGRMTGNPTTSSTAQPNFFTLDHPAFTTFKPRMGEDANGKWTALHDENGNVILDKTPIYISKEFEGPLKAILTQQDGPLYRSYMLLKSKAMSAIMFSPLIHNMVIAGRALAYAGIKLPALYYTGHAARLDPDLMTTAISHGMVPISGSNHSMIDVGDIARGVGKDGGWGDPNESWIGLGAKAVGNKLVPGLGTKLKSGIDAAGNFWHGTLLWDRIGDLQAGIFQDAYGKALKKGMDDNAAATYAAHVSNRYAGAVGRENMSAIARKFANVILFSRSFNMGNLGAVKDVFYGMPAGLKAQMMEKSSAASAELGLTMAKRKAFTGLVTDLAATILVTSAVQDWVRRNKDDPAAKQIADAFGGYSQRAADMWQGIKDHPGKMGSYDPYRLSSTWGNEPGKQDRVDMGPQASGRHEYMRLPTGKVVEDTIGWLSHPSETFVKKMSPLAKAGADIATNDKGFGVPVWDPSGSTMQKATDIAMHLVQAQVPWDTLRTGYDLANGRATDLDKSKLKGNLTGLSISQGHPAGPQGQVAAKTEERVKASKAYVMEEVKRSLKYEDTEHAQELLERTGMTPKEASRVIRGIDNPRSGLSKSAAKKFGQHANDEERETMDAVGR